MNESMRKKFIELLNIYGSDFDMIANTDELGGMTSEVLCSKYPEILDTYFSMNTELNQEEIDWLQIKEIYYMNERFYFDVLVGELGGSHVIKNGRDLEVGKELVLLLKDYEFMLLSKLSILDRLYKSLYRDGMLSEDLSRRICIPKSSEERSRRARSPPHVEEPTAKKKPANIAIVVKNIQESTKDVEDKDKDGTKAGSAKDSIESSPKEAQGDAADSSLDQQVTKKDNTAGLDYSAILRLSREQKK
ncbi:hypothetical protein [Encephalitozoon cuniculi GB-M1]|uniref:Uncharacterized protein n=1 Tax=Encephalitozoon cuniculi (strain GB-M1) TaxID=284813 RepID=Q8SVC8_ENCCU|nr:uncharacterized protein ECU06_0560 [Encephalitozoon cuniculi GB-M1]CAD25416.1 hypothetical protein [Encephalitozoon cuniculi GB-M1]